jgi:hypothetical protein
MVMEELTDEQKQRLQAAIKERFAAKGFVPVEMWAWYERVHNGTPVTVREMQTKVLGEARRRGWLAEANLDYEPAPVGEHEDFPLPKDGDWDITAWPNFGGSEGIYIDFVLKGRYRGEDIPRFPDAYGLNVDAIDRDDRSKGVDITYRLHCGKTLDEDLAGMERMALLTGRLLWLVRAIPW